jgi:hypothetical protein
MSLDRKGVVPMKKNLPEEHSLIHRICYGTYSSLKSLIESCYYSQVQWRNSAGSFPSEMAICKELCTVRVTCSRRSGHTTAIARVVPEYFNRALILTPKRIMIDILHKAFVDIYSEFTEVSLNNETPLFPPIREVTGTKLVTEDSEYVFASIGSLKYLRQYQFEAVIIDCAFLLTDRQVDEIYHELAPSMVNFSEKFFIFVE